MIRQFFIAAIVVLLSLSVYAQTDTSEVVEGREDDDEGMIVKPDHSGPLRMGIKLGVGYSTMLGGELDNPTGSVGIEGSGYLRYRFKPRWAVQTEVGASFRGSNFNNKSGEYSAIKTYYLDVPLMLVAGLNKTANSNLLAGLQYSYLLNSSIYMTDANNAEPEAPGLKKHDLLAVLGGQFYTPFVGFQIVAKYGLIDINDGLLGAKTKPAYKGKDIHNFAIEFNIIF